MKPENTEKRTKHHPSNSFPWPGLLYCSTGVGIGVVSVTLSLEIFGTDISMDGRHIGNKGGGCVKNKEREM